MSEQEIPKCVGIKINSKDFFKYMKHKKNLEEKISFWIQWKREINGKKGIYQDKSDHADSIHEALVILDTLLNNKKTHDITITKTYSFPDKKGSVSKNNDVN